MKSIFINSPAVAHRGAWKNGPGAANSMTAFRDAIAKGFACFECDTLLTQDNQVVVAHGPMSGEDGGVPGDLPIAESTYAKLTQVDLGNGDTFPLLKNVLAEVRKQFHTRMIIEIKETPDGRNLKLAEKIVQLVRAQKAEPWVSYISFDYQILLRVLELEPGAKCSPLQNDHPIEKYVADGMSGVDFNHTEYTSAEQVQAYQAADLTVNAWTVNEPERMQQLLDWGLDLITTDEPEILARL